MGVVYDADDDNEYENERDKNRHNHVFLYIIVKSRFISISHLDINISSTTDEVQRKIRIQCINNSLTQ